MISTVRAWAWYGPAGLLWMRAALATSDATAARRYAEAGWPTRPFALRLAQTVRRRADGLRSASPTSVSPLATAGDWSPPRSAENSTSWVFEIAADGAVVVLARGADVAEATAVLTMCERLSAAARWAMPPGGGLGAQALRAVLSPAGVIVRGAVLAGDAAIDRNDAARIAAGGGFVIALGVEGPVAAASALDSALRR